METGTDGPGGSPRSPDRRRLEITEEERPGLRVDEEDDDADDDDDNANNDADDDDDDDDEEDNAHDSVNGNSGALGKDGRLKDQSMMRQTSLINDEALSGTGFNTDFNTAKRSVVTRWKSRDFLPSFHSNCNAQSSMTPLFKGAAHNSQPNVISFPVEFGVMDQHENKKWSDEANRDR